MKKFTYFSFVILANSAFCDEKQFLYFFQFLLCYLLFSSSFPLLSATETIVPPRTPRTFRCSSTNGLTPATKTTSAQNGSSQVELCQQKAQKPRKRQCTTASEVFYYFIYFFFWQTLFKIFYKQTFALYINICMYAGVWVSAKNCAVKHYFSIIMRSFAMLILSLHWLSLGANLIENQQVTQMKQRRLKNTRYNTKSGQSEMVRHFF